MQKKNGISLIVLVITIIVMIVLAGAIILTLNNSGIINKASDAVIKSDYNNIKTYAQLEYSRIMLGEDTNGLSVGEWIKQQVINNGIITADETQKYKFRNNGDVIQLGTKSEYKYTIIDSKYYTISENNEFNLTTEGKTAVKDGTITELVVPYGVTSIAASAASNGTSLTNVILPDTVSHIGDSAFSGCTNLTTVVMSKGIVSIGTNAFYNTPYLTRLTSNNDLVILGSCLVSGTNVTGKVIIPNIVETIACGAFKANENITEVYIPSTVTAIKSSAFYGCTSLEVISGATGVTEVGDSVFYNTKWLNNQPDGLIYFGPVLLSYKGTMQENTTITIKEGTTEIKASVFKDQTNLTKVNLPTSLKTIGNSAFENCSSLEMDLIIPKGVTVMKQSTFKGCSKLKSVEMSENMITIESYAFYKCTKITKVDLKNVVEIYSQAFEGCTALNTIEGANSLITVREDVFKSTAWLNAQKSVATDGLVVLGKSLVDGSNASGKVVIPEGIVSIASYAFYNNDNITEVEFPTTLLRFENGTGDAFGEYCGAFYSCGGITTITIPINVELIGSGTFKECSKLTTINFLGEIPTCNRSSFYGTKITGDIKTRIIEKNANAFLGNVSW